MKGEYRHKGLNSPTRYINLGENGQKQDIILLARDLKWGQVGATGNLQRFMGSVVKADNKDKGNQRFSLAASGRAGNLSPTIRVEGISNNNDMMWYHQANANNSLVPFVPHF